MRRHWQHTSFCMGQCVSSCGSKRTLDSVPTTPDTENYPGLIPITRPIIFAENYDCPFSEHQVLAAVHKSPSKGSSAAKFVTAFSQKKIVARRINPGSECPINYSKQSPPSTLPLKITTLLTPGPVGQHGDMKGSPVKNYFRETISSAKKSSSKTVTFSEETRPNTEESNRIRKRSFFPFIKSKGTSDKVKRQDSESLTFSKSFLRTKSKSRTPVPTNTKPVKEKQICRVILSPKQGSSKTRSTEGSTTVSVENQNTQNSSLPSENLKKTNGGFLDDKAESNDQIFEEGSPRMGNARSRDANLSDLAKSYKSVVKSNSTNVVSDKKVDINENTSHFPLVSSKSSDSQGFIQREHDSVKQTDSGVLRNINLIKEENRLLRLKFFTEESSQISTSQKASLETQTPKMNRKNFYGSKSAIPQPKAFAAKSSTTSGLPKLYSISTGISNQEQTSNEGSTGRSKSIADAYQQPTNLNNGKWMPAAEYFDQPKATDLQRPHTSPGVARRARRLSEPVRPHTGSNTGKFIRKNEPLETHAERRGTVGYQPRKFPAKDAGALPRPIKATVTSERTTSIVKSSSTKVGVRKPEETKPFYTIGLYQNRPKSSDVPRSFGVLQSGFSGVSTGMVKQRTEQFQSKVSEQSKLVSRLSLDNVEQKYITSESPSPRRPGVMRSATYTIRKHATAEPKNALQSPERAESSAQRLPKGNTDPKYLTWTVRDSLGHGSDRGHQKLDDYHHREMRESSSPDTGILSSSFPNARNYSLQHDTSGASTSSVGTNEDGTGDHVPISDSEYLIDDEISDQPDLTLTFKESSLVLSSSSSGESLLSCDIMLDHLDPHHERIMGELTSDSAISDMSSHKPSAKITDQIHKFSDTKRTVLEEASKTQERLRSPIEVASPATVRTIRHPKSPRKTSNTRLTTSATSVISSRPTRYPSGDTSIPRIASNTYKSPTSGSSIPIKNRTTPEKRPPTTKIAQAKPLATATSLSPASKSSTAKKDQVAGLTIENVSKLHKKLELVNSEHNSVEVDHTSCLPVPFVEELMSEFEELRVKLGQLQLQLETQEKRESEKDELIQRLTGEVERLKSTVGDENIHKSLHLNGTVLSVKNNDAVDGLAPKDLYLNNLNYENAAVQTENNNIFNRVVTYPEEEDKYGELVRIGRSSSVKKKL